MVNSSVHFTAFIDQEFQSFVNDVSLTKFLQFLMFLVYTLTLGKLLDRVLLQKWFFVISVSGFAR